MVSRRTFLNGGLALACGSLAPQLFGCENQTNDTDSVSINRKIPVRYDADVVVIGGGIAGASAACAAAKSGASVVLVERFAETGGMLSTGGVANFCGQIEEQGEVFDEILAGLKRFNAREEGGRKCVFHYEMLALVLQEMLLGRGVKLLLHTRLVDVIVKNRNVSECIICGKSGMEAIRGKVFIDCSGDADLARFAGFSTTKGDKDGHQLPMSQISFVREIDEKDTFIQTPADFYHPIRNKEDLPMTSIWPDGPGGKALKIKIPMFDSTSTESLTQAEIAARRRLMEVLYYYQSVEKKNWRFTHWSPIIGIREGCRITGDYVLTVDDLRAGKSFDDGVARGTFYLDGHKPTDDKRTYILPQDQLHVPPYQIPMRSLIAKDSDNLLMAGRCFSADQLALSSARVSTSSSMMGQAAGIAAAMSVGKKCKIRDLDYSEIRKEVLNRGAQLDVSVQRHTIFP